MSDDFILKSKAYKEMWKRDIEGKPMSLKFAPPKEKAFQYATYVEYAGRGDFKVHRNLGAAKQVYRGRAGSWNRNNGNSRPFKILHLVDGDWYVLYDIPSGTKWEDLPWVKETTQRIFGRDSEGNWVRTDKLKKKAAPISREEYAEFRVAVELEKRGIV